LRKHLGRPSLSSLGLRKGSILKNCYLTSSARLNDKLSERRVRDPEGRKCWSAKKSTEL
jgi:hypothetical protein